MTALRNFEPPSRWSNPDGTLTDRAQGYLRSLFTYIGANTGIVPVGSLGGDGTTTTTFLREDGNFAVPNYPTGANPTASVGLSAANGIAVTFMRSDAAPALDVGISPTWTGAHIFSQSLQAAALVAVDGFGCNGKTAQTEVTVNAAVAGTAGAAYTATEQTMINDLKALVNQLRAALVANGICV